MRILAYNADGVEDLQNWVLNKLDETLENCDLCIKQYHTGKIWLMDLLKEDYEDDDIATFFRRIDELDIKRITRNLSNAEQQLNSVPPEQRGLNVLDRPALLSIFETLSCEAMLLNEELLQQHFDKPFKLIQTRRSLKINDYVPAVTRFLFDPNSDRSFWAVSTWTRYSRPPTAIEFDWAIRDGLLSALQAASAQPPQFALVQRLWRGMQLITKKLDKAQITHQLRALEIDPCRLSVDHLAIPIQGLRFLLNTIQTMIEKAPGDFWDAMQTISPQAIIEHTLHNSQFVTFLMQTTDGEPYDKSPLKDMLSWMVPFLSSLKGAQQPSACRALALPLLKRFQDKQLPNLARYHCFHVGLQCLLHTLRFFTDNEGQRSSVGRIVLKETMEVLEDTIGIILEPPTFTVEASLQEGIVNLCYDVVRNTLALECQSLKSDYEVILKHGTLSHGVSTSTGRIWDAVVKHLHQDNIGLSSSALLGILPLVGLEKFPTKGESTEEKKHFNTIYGHLTHLSCQIIERLADFDPAHVKKLFESQDTTCSIISTLFAADLNTYQAAIDMIKNVSGQSARRDAISYLLDSYFITSMYGLSWSFRRISNMKTFAPAPRMLHTGRDIVEILCNSQTGILRTRNIRDRREVLSLQKLWEFLWLALTTIFDETEAWHMRGNEKSVMLDFCRDTIEFADFLFNQYAVFLGAVGDTLTEASEVFLKPPTLTMSAMVKWLRLKDDYLANTLVNLVAQLLRRLGSLEVTSVKSDALNFIEGVAVNGTIKTILTPRDKAELVRSLEAYYKKPVVTASTASLKKQSKLTSFAKTSELSSPATSRASDDDFDDIPDAHLLELSRSVELNKDRMAAQAKSKPTIAAKTLAMANRPRLPSALAGSSKVAPPRPRDDARLVSSFREKREREKEAKKKRDQEALARLKKNLPMHGVAELTAEQGSGLKGIGIKGKDHAIPGESMMVSSGSDSDSSSEDELDKDLFGAKAKKPDAVAAYEQSKKMSMQQQPVKKTKRNRSMRDMRARLSPDLSSLHHAILNWDFFASGDSPPSSANKDYTLVSNTFRSPHEYQGTFEPLLILEAWQGFQQSKEEGIFRPFEVKVMSRANVDSWIEFSTQPLGQVSKDFFLSEGDLILFSASSNPTNDPTAGHVLARVWHINRKGGKQEITYRMNPSAGTNKFSATLGTGSKAWGAKITSLIPVEREYGALMALDFYDLAEEIVMAKPSPILTYSDAKMQTIMDNYTINRPQAKAIRSAIDNDGFTLIQGPPGSGKTKTITALVGSLLTNVLNNVGIPIASGANTQRPPSRKILVCAPSNAAVDELVMRLKTGIKTIQGRHEQISIVRLGRSEAINAQVLDVTLDEMVTKRLNKDPAKGNGVDMQKLYEEHKKTDNSFKEIRTNLDDCRAKGLPPPEEMEREFELLKKKRSQLSSEIDKARDQVQAISRNADINKRRVQQEIIDGAHVICTTLSGSGHEIFQGMNVEFETVIIDEAAQCIELSALIPLKYGCSKCVLVGDPKQLPPTVLSKMASKFQYEQSLFVRMQKNHPKDVHLLDIQYRMHPEISRFPSTSFYDGKLQDGDDMAKLRARPWHQSELLSPYRFFDVEGMHQSAAKGHSLVNYAEIRVAIQLYERLLADFKGYDFNGKIGVITPYKGQLKELKQQFAHRHGEDILKRVDFNTTDAFQGRESEIIIFSCVRASNKGIGFLADIRRMNVGLTRAKSSLWVLGSSRALTQGEFWNNLIRDARNRNIYTEGNITELLDRPQFTGYKHAEMVDVDTIPSPAPEPSVPQSAPSTTSSNLPEDTVAHKPPPVVNTPKPLETAPQQGPSGGGNSLDETRTCAICGSAGHFTSNCDNDDAKEAARGKCNRCGAKGHIRKYCTADRCIECGQFGHTMLSCQAPGTLSKRQKERIKLEERHFRELKTQISERRRQNQAGNHDRRVPVIQTSTRPEDNAGNKRKRPDMSPTGIPDGPKASRPRTENQHPPPNAPKGPRAAAPPPPPVRFVYAGPYPNGRSHFSQGLVKPSRDMPIAPLANHLPPANAPSGPAAQVCNTNPASISPITNLS